MIRGIHHAQITVPPGAEDAARAFYTGVLGLAEVEKPDALKPRGGLWLQAGALQLHIGVEDGVDRRATKAHVAYEVDDLATCRARLAEAGAAIEACVAIPGLDRFELRDPFGNRLELLQVVGPS